MEMNNMLFYFAAWNDFNSPVKLGWDLEKIHAELKFFIMDVLRLTH